MHVLTITASMPCGTIVIDGDRYKIRPGWLGAITSSWLLVQDRGRAPFVLLSLTIAASGVTTRYAGAGAASASRRWRRWPQGTSLVCVATCSRA